MKMKKHLSLFFAAVLVIAAVLTGCGGGGSTGTSEPADSETTESEAAGSDSAAGFEADAVIGVALPWLGTQNWAEADEMFKAELAAAGFSPIVQHADNKVPQQQQQIESMIQNGAKVIVVGPVDGSQLGAVLEEAKAAGISIIGYDRLLENTTGVDGVVQFGSIKTGELQGQALLDGLAANKGAGPYNIELFGGGPADPNAPNFFKGAMLVLQPKIDDGTLVVVSGQTDFTQCATLDWDNSKAQARMDSLLSGFYAD
jgi:putative multiple sugar transport system substrate-binding protein